MMVSRKNCLLFKGSSACSLPSEEDIFLLKQPSSLFKLLGTTGKHLFYTDIIS